MRREKSPEAWKDSFTLPMFIGKQYALLCGRYKGLRLLDHGMKIWEKLLCEWLKRRITIDDCQFGFMTGKSTTNAIFITRHLQEKYKVKRKRLYHVCGSGKAIRQDSKRSN